jgi:hypothetical protein
MAEPESAKEITVSIGSLPETFDVLSKGESWNGFAVPYFPEEEALRFLEVFNGEGGGRARFTSEGVDETPDAVVVDDEEGEEPRIFSAVEVGGKKTYPIGAYCWTWRKVQDGK